MGRRTSVGLDIGTSGVRAAELSLGKGVVTLERFGQVPLPPGVVRDGEVVDVPAVAEAISRLWSQAKFSTKKVVIGVANQRVVVRQVDLPWMPLPELRSSLSFLVQDFIPMPVEQALLDAHPVEEFVADSGARMLRVLLVAAARDMVVSAVDAVTRAGLTPVQVELTPFALLRSMGTVEELPSSLGDAEALVDVGARVTNIVVHQNGVPRFVRILLMGGDTITEALADRLGVPVEQAEAVKQQLAMSTVPGVLDDDHPATRAMEQAGSAFVDEVRGSLDYYRAQPSAAPIGRLVLSGGGSRLGNLVDRLGAATRLPVQPAGLSGTVKPGRRADLGERSPDIDALATVSVGLAMEVAS